VAGELQRIYETQQEIQTLKKSLKSLEENLDVEMTYVLWKGITEDGDYALKEVQRNHHDIVPAKFKVKFPDIYESVVSITKKDAEKALRDLYKTKKVDAFFEDVTVTRTNISHAVVKKK
jgi:hypothetical protein